MRGMLGENHAPRGLAGKVVGKQVKGLAPGGIRLVGILEHGVDVMHPRCPRSIVLFTDMFLRL